MEPSSTTGARSGTKPGPWDTRSVTRSQVRRCRQVQQHPKRWGSHLFQPRDRRTPSAVLGGQLLHPVTSDWDDIDPAATVKPPDAVVWPAPTMDREAILTIATQALPKRVVFNTFDRIDAQGIPDEQNQQEHVCIMLASRAKPTLPDYCSYGQSTNGEPQISLPKGGKESYATLQAAWFPPSPTEGEVSVTWIIRY